MKRALIKRLEAERVRLNNQGYDSCGCYYGAGQKLFVIYDNETGESYFERAPNARAARAAIVARHTIKESTGER